MPITQDRMLTILDAANFYRTRAERFLEIALDFAGATRRGDISPHELEDHLRKAFMTTRPPEEITAAIIRESEHFKHRKAANIWAKRRQERTRAEKKLGIYQPRTQGGIQDSQLTRGELQRGTDKYQPADRFSSIPRDSNGMFIAGDHGQYRLSREDMERFQQDAYEGSFEDYLKAKSAGTWLQTPTEPLPEKISTDGRITERTAKLADGSEVILKKDLGESADPDVKIEGDEF